MWAILLQKAIHLNLERYIMSAKIYRPTKTAMQSGKAKTKEWVLEFVPEDSRVIEPLMGWSSNSDTKQQLKLKFKTRQEAENYAKNRHIDYIVVEPQQGSLHKQAYAENFLV